MFLRKSARAFCICICPRGDMTPQSWLPNNFSDFEDAQDSASITSPHFWTTKDADLYDSSNESPASVLSYVMDSFIKSPPGGAHDAYKLENTVSVETGFLLVNLDLLARSYRERLALYSSNEHWHRAIKPCYMRSIPVVGCCVIRPRICKKVGNSAFSYEHKCWLAVAQILNPDSWSLQWYLFLTSIISRCRKV